MQPQDPLEDMHPHPAAPRRLWIHLLLFLLTVLTTMLAGAELVTNKTWWRWTSDASTWLYLDDLWQGLPYSLAFLAFLTSHEFGHYFMAVYHRVRTSLPYYIPIFIPLMPLNIGSLGAVIRLRQMPRSTGQYFDIGIAGPLAGFVVSLGLLIYGFATLPPLDYLYQMNPYAKDFGHIPSADEIVQRYGGGLVVGQSLLFQFLEWAVADPTRLPNHFELIHYPFLFAGYLTLFFTALNLMPIGQLDGGHVVYGLLGHVRAGLVSRAAVLCLILYGGMGPMEGIPGVLPRAAVVALYVMFLIYAGSRILGSYRLLPLAVFVGSVLLLQQSLQALLHVQTAYPMWLFYALMALRVIGLDHPQAVVEHKLDRKRKVLGVVALCIFVLCFSPKPMDIVVKQETTGVFTQTQTAR